MRLGGYEQRPPRCPPLVHASPGACGRVGTAARSDVKAWQAWRGMVRAGQALAPLPSHSTQVDAPPTLLHLSYLARMVPWNGPKTKVQLKLTSQRCSLLQEKKNAMAKKDRREIASLVERGKIETARVKTEGLYNEDLHIELLEIMELYAEMLIVSSRTGL